FARSQWRKQNLEMLKVRHSLYWQAGALGIAIALVFALSRFFPVIEFIDALQRRVMSLGAWAAVCYPLLFAACNILLLPGGILAVGAGFFFGLWWGFFCTLTSGHWGNLQCASCSTRITHA